MITLNEAIKIAERWRGSKIKTIVDCNDRWDVTFEADYPKAVAVFDENLPDFVKDVLLAPDVIHTFIFKDDGRCEFFYAAEHIELLAAGRPVELPDK